MPKIPSDYAIGRLSVYRRLLVDMLSDNKAFARSDDLAAAAGVGASQVRRDLMLVGVTGSTKGYGTQKLLEAIEEVISPAEVQQIALVGVGNLGRAVLAHLAGRRPKLAITVAFDKDPAVTNRLVHGCPCRPLSEMAKVVSELGIDTAILAVPADAAQAVADILVPAGVRGIVNFAPTRLRVASGVFVENVDLSSSLEKAAFFARQLGDN